MSAKKSRPAWTPSEARLVAQYARSRAEKEVEDYATAKADAERGIAKIKADALREAAESLPAPVGLKCNAECHDADRLHLRIRADRIEEEA